MPLRYLALAWLALALMGAAFVADLCGV